RKEDLDTPVEVARHQVRRPDKDLLVAAVAEVVDPRVLEEPADDRADRDPVADTRHARAQAAYPTDLEVDLDAGLRGPAKRRDALPVHERVHLEDYPAVPADPVPRDLALDPAEDPVAQRDRGDEERAVLL